MNQVAPGNEEEEEGGPVDRVAQPREANHCDGGRQRGVRSIRSGGVESTVSAGGGST